MLTQEKRTERIQLDSAIAWVVFIGCAAARIDTQVQKCDPGWFGVECVYKCRCRSGSCDDRGRCVGGGGCQKGWFGPECQYVDLAFGGTGNPQLTDGNDSSCVKSSSHRNLTVNFSREYLFTWLRLVFINSSNQTFDLLFKEQGRVEKCHHIIHAADARLLDIHCRYNSPFKVLVLIGQHSDLCSLHVSGGRNIALRQKSSQSSTYFEMSNKTLHRNVSYGSWRAVDGNVNPDFYGGGTCSRTQFRNGTNVIWSAVFRGVYNVGRYVLYVPNNDTMYGGTFTIMSRDDNGTLVFASTIRGAQLNPVFTIISRVVPLHAFYINSTTQHLALCEVEIYGDTMCPAGRFGWDCEHTCRCPPNSHCYVSSGQCYPQCDPGFETETCTPCRPGTYGDKCQFRCSQFCAKDDHSVIACNNVHGTCLRGCDRGYQPPFCLPTCPPGLYGPNCSHQCSQTCAKKNSSRPCDAWTGACLYGCQDGFVGASCSTACDGASYGPGCSLRCSPLCTRLSDDPANFCDNVQGDCLFGCQMGFTGTNCSQTCKAGTYGYDCGSKCPATCTPPKNPMMTSCNFTDGDCLYGCVSGYYGVGCHHHDVHHSDPDVKRPSEVNVLYILAFCGALFVLALLMICITSSRQRASSNEEDIHSFVSIRQQR